jgi:pyruvate kinase
MKAFRRTKIVATIGPASQDPDTIRSLIKAGVNVFRLNFSHGDQNSHLETINHIKKIRENLAQPIAILQDLAGPKIRLGQIAKEPFHARVGDTIILDGHNTGESNNNTIGLNYSGFAKDVFPGSRLLLSDGDLELKVVKIEKSKVYCKVIIGGNLYSHKGVNFPSGSFNLSALTEKDEEDLEFGLKNGVDMVAMSFVRTAKDLDKARKIFKKARRSIPLIAKIEKHEAIKNLPEIIEAADAIMVARGDLGVEIPIEKVPMVQKEIIKQANCSGKPVITATQMLRSMVTSPRPTRAEVTDVANAIFDGTDAVMLSEETAVGKYPDLAVETMSKIAHQAEKSIHYYKELTSRKLDKKLIVPESVAHSATILARDLNARIIFAATRTGYTAKTISKYRPKSLIIALVVDESVYSQMALVWGVFPIMVKFQNDLKKFFNDSFDKVLKTGLAKKKDHYVFASGFPLGKPGSLNQVTAGKIN